jgi:hypothetical protein
MDYAQAIEDGSIWSGRADGKVYWLRPESMPFADLLICKEALAVKYGVGWDDIYGLKREQFDLIPNHAVMLPDDFEELYRISSELWFREIVDGHDD